MPRRNIKCTSNSDRIYQQGQSQCDELHKHFLNKLLAHFATKKMLDDSMYVLSRDEFDKSITDYVNKYFKKYKVVAR
jgi:hypothetical protein